MTSSSAMAASVCISREKLENMSAQFANQENPSNPSDVLTNKVFTDAFAPVSGVDNAFVINNLFIATDQGEASGNIGINGVDDLVGSVHANNNGFLAVVFSAAGTQNGDGSSGGSNTTPISIGGQISTTTTSASGPPALSNIDISNEQASEFVRQRRELAQNGELEPLPGDENQQQQATTPQQAPAQQQAPQQQAPAQQQAAAPQQAPAQQQAAAVQSQPQASTQQSAAAQPKPVKPSVTKKKKAMPGSSELEVVTYEDAMQMQPPAMADDGIRYGSWAQVYVDYEKHKNLSPGKTDNPTRKTNTGGALGGFDITLTPNADANQFMQLGLFAGYNKSKSKFTDTPGVRNARQEERGGFIGGYANFHRDGFTLETMAKVDFFKLSKRQIVKTTTVEKTAAKTTTITPKCDGPDEVLLVDNASDAEPTSTTIDADEQTTTAEAFKNGQVRENNYTFGTNIYYRFEPRNNLWIEPFVGAMYTYTEFGSKAASLDLTDGKVLRIQGGLRSGTAGRIGDSVLSISMMGLLYSDVLVEGFTLDGNGFVSNVSNVDEGKLRALGQLNLALTDSYGWTYALTGEVRGGEDVIGYGGRATIRLDF